MKVWTLVFLQPGSEYPEVGVFTTKERALVEARCWVNGKDTDIDNEAEFTAAWEWDGPNYGVCRWDDCLIYIELDTVKS